MRRNREWSLKERNATRNARWLWNAVQAFCVIWLALLVTSCVAQRADLVKMEEDFKGKISKLDREKRTLAQTLEEAKENIAASKAMLEEQKNELDELRKASARLNLDLQRRHEESQANVVSELETQAHELETQARRLTQIDVALKKGLERGAAERSTQIDGLRKSVERTLAQRNKRVNKEFADFQKSLVEFKKTLAQVNKRLVQALKEEQDRATSSETTLQRDFTKQQEAFHAKLDADTQTLKQYVEASVKTTMTTVNEALKKLANRLNADLKAQAEVVERETGRISQELAKMETALQKTERTVSANVTQTQTQVTTQAKNVQELRQAVVQMRGVLDSMGKLLGERGDEQMKQVGQTMARLDRMEQAQSSETAKQAETTQAISTHLTEVTASVESVVQSFEEFKTAVTARLNEQAESVASSAKASDVRRLQQELKANVKHGNELSQSIAKLKDVSNDLVTKLGSKIDEHESRIAELQKALTTSRQSAPKSKSP